MIDKPKIKWGWRFCRWGLIGVAVIITLGALVITEENWRGKREWENYKRQAAAKGDFLDQILGSTNKIPDEQNFTKAPVFSALAARTWDEKEIDWKPGGTHLVDPLKMSISRSDGSGPEHGWLGNWQLARLIDLKEWQNYYRTSPRKLAGEFPVAPHSQTPSADVLLALSKYDSAIEKLRVASRRPYSRFADDYADDLKTGSRVMEYLLDFKFACSVIELRALAELGGGETAKAFDDVQLLLRLNDALRQEPLLITHLVSLATMNPTLQPIYEGLARRQWSDAQLAELEEELAAKDFLADYRKAMRGELGFALASLENERRTRKTIEDSSDTNKITAISFWLMPSAFFYQNELASARLNEQVCAPLVDLEKRIASPEGERRAEGVVRAEMHHYQPYKILALMNFPDISRSVEIFAMTQVYADLAQVACALERYRLAQGGYPETLESLVPRFIAKLPHDIINGQPLHYRRAPDGKFILYSVGWNEKDDGGQPGATKRGAVDRKKGDWVWQYPPE